MWFPVIAAMLENRTEVAIWGVGESLISRVGWLALYETTMNQFLPLVG